MRSNTRGRTAPRRPETTADPRTKLLVEDVALWRLLAAERALPYGWIKLAAAARGVSSAAITTAIGGRSWHAMSDPAPVRAQQRWAHRSNPQQRPRCPACGQPKYRVRSCRHSFHTVDHRTTRHAPRRRASTA